MYGAPQVDLTAHCLPVAGGLAGMHQTIHVMRAMVNQSRKLPEIRACAVNLIFMMPERGVLGHVASIFGFVRDTILYVRDVNGVETLQSPDKTLLLRIGDCDDQTMLLCALLESVGYPTRFVCAGYARIGVFEHVYCQVYANGVWIDLDPTEQQPLGWAPENPVAYWIEGNALDR